MKRLNNFVLRAILLLVFKTVSSLSIAQIEHNFKKDPEKTDCHTLTPPFDSEQAGIELIEASSFRFVQEMTISKYRVPKAVYFYSCDGENGYLIAEESKGLKKLYPEVPKSVWDDFIKDKDPVGFYRDKIQPLK